MSEVYETAIVKKRNVLNELRASDLTLQELRFFSIYLSKINPKDEKTRIVRFPLADFQKIMGFGRMNIQQLRSSTNSLLKKVVNIPKKNGGYTGFQLFKECEVDQDELGDWYVSIDAHDKALPLLFDYKERYFKYELWNALRLKSPNQIRMYEILKQYESLGKREISVKDLRELLGIADTEYATKSGWSDFKKYVLESCKRALKETSDICFEYERGKTGTGGKWLTIIFTIHKNEPTNTQMSLFEQELALSDYIDLKKLKGSEPEETPERLSEALQSMAMFADELPLKDVKEIYYAMQEAAIYDDIFLSFKRLYQTAVNNNPKSLKGYILGIIKGDKSKERDSEPDSSVDPDIEKYKKVINKPFPLPEVNENE